MAWNKYVTVEVPLLLCMFCLMLQLNVSTNMLIYRTCYALLDYDESECALLGKVENETTASLERKVQPTFNYINMVSTVMNSLVPLVFCMYVGTWSDKFGRKPFMLLSLIGLTLTNMTTTIIVLFENASPWLFLISFIPSLLTGGFVTLMIVISAYLADVSTSQTRVVRMAVYEIVMGLGTFLGNIVSSYLLYGTDYKTVYIIITGLHGVATIYTFFFIPESIKGEKQVPKLKHLLKYINLTDIAKNTFKKRPNNARGYLLAVLGIIFFQTFSMGEMSVQTLFLRAKLNWTLTKITITSSVTSVGNIIGTIGGTYFLYKLLKIGELKLALFSILSFSAASILRGLSTMDKDYFIYIASFIGIFNGIQGIMIRTIISYIVSPEEIGKIFALQSIIMNVNMMLSNLLFQAIYNATLETDSGIFYFVSATINGLAGVGILLLLNVKVPVHPEAAKEAEKPENEFRKISMNINNFEVLSIDEKRSSNTISLGFSTIPG
ncbi:unnamed protein product [Psylliodes chrysocephalus]|uniref:Major facilitator superfamily (MFS) profile domain-containing protein n=1 Tax=Psylliodes chrysocephalus TaxID=3402493 RepID=A0A9P0CTX3_9CUCU|nr:unnamed protein product [Psylliodes chrysocephala]